MLLVNAVKVESSKQLSHTCRTSNSIEVSHTTILHQHHSHTLKVLLQQTHMHSCGCLYHYFRVYNHMHAIIAINFLSLLAACNSYWPIPLTEFFKNVCELTQRDVLRGGRNYCDGGGGV